MEDALKIVDHYGFPLLALFCLWKVLAPLAREAEREMAIKAAQAARSAHARLDKMGAPAAAGGV